MKLKEYLETRKISKNIFKVIVLTVFVLSLNSLSYAYFTSTIEGEGKVSIGYSSSDTSFNSIGKTGGSKSINFAHSHTVNSHTHTTGDHTLTVDEMPNHGYHLFKSFADAAGNGTARRFLSSSYLSTSGSTGRGWTIWNANESYPAGQNLGGSAAHNHGETSASSPGTTSELSTSQSVLNPYIVSAKWIRVS